jgi:diacylglycerol kinase
MTKQITGEKNPIPHTRSMLAKFSYALAGVLWTIKTQVNMRIHLVATILVVSLGLIIEISSNQWCLIVLCCSLVLSLEAMNSSLEEVVNHISPEYNLFAKHAKDAAAGAVLISAIASLLIGLIIFLPPIMKLLSKS